MKMKLWGTMSALAVVGTIGLGVALRGNGGADVTVPEEPPVAVRLASVEWVAEREPVVVPGRVTRRSEADLAFKVGGLVAAVPVRQGDRVVAGQRLAVLDLEEVEAELARAKAALEQARRDFERVSELRAANVVPPQDLDRAETALALAEAALRVASFNRQHAEIVAPADGRILSRHVEPGELVSPGMPVVGFVADDQPWIARIGLSERVAATLEVGAKASIRLSNGELVRGVLRRIGSSLDSVTRTLPAEVELLEAPRSGWSGQVATVTLQATAGPERVRVPASALVEGSGDQAWVVVVEDGVARRMRVEIDQFEGKAVMLRTLLPQGTRIVVAGAERVRDGERVREGVGSMVSSTPAPQVQMHVKL